MWPVGLLDMSWWQGYPVGHLHDGFHWPNLRRVPILVALNGGLWYRQVVSVDRDTNEEGAGCNGGPYVTAIGISLREGGSSSSNSFQNTNNFKGPFPCILCCCLRLRMSATGAVLIELCRVSTNSSLSSLACLAFLRRLTIEY